jgi:serine-type D-Ala-D-Ala carboxypeptidase/endopeptidase (penicillin-binding protein 4)
MKKGINLLYLLTTFCCYGQIIPQKLNLAFKQLEADSQLRHGIAAITVLELKTGKVIFEKNGQVGLTPASTQKIFTSMAALDLIGKDFVYKTDIGYEGTIKDSILHGNLYVIGRGDPSLGSDRWTNTNYKDVLLKIVGAVQKKGIREIRGEIVVGNNNFSQQSTPSGWLWEDIGSYFGAGAYSINWMENQYEVSLSSGSKLNEKVKVEDVAPSGFDGFFVNELRTDKKGTGDKAYIFPSIDPNSFVLIKGTIPVDEKNFKISGAVTNPPHAFRTMLANYLSGNRIVWMPPNQRLASYPPLTEYGYPAINTGNVFLSISSPSLDSINFYFLRKSVNLFGEAFIKTIAYEKVGYGSTEKGVELVKDYWAQHGIEKSALKIVDGSGLSPQNRVTTNAMVKALQHATTRPWFSSFYRALPEYNGMKIKSGSIGGARAYTGYHGSVSGKEYIVAIIVNNYDGSAAVVVKKIFKVLDALK